MGTTRLPSLPTETWTQTLVWTQGQKKSCSMCQHLEICLNQGKVGFAGVLKLSWLKTTKLFFFTLPRFTSYIGWELTHVILTLELHIPRIIEAGKRGYGDSLTSSESFFLL